ncbi:MAG: glycosyltransferase family 2 protein [Candidatus Roizmanbacteria bacterium]|nr:glycosyltransferase family 2 protein [Candidatus Roizmanbacteria bacterium]
MKKIPISIIIPVYKNYEMFFKYLEINKKYFDGCEIIVMNDYPLKNISKPVKKIYSEAIIINNKKNLGFAGNVNRGVLKTTRNYIFLMNSDVVLKDNSFLTSLNHFQKDKKLFAVGFAQIEKNGKIVGANRGYFQNGLINHGHLTPNLYHLTPIFWAEGGSSIFRKKLFIDLGLLDELYNPFYWEDIDLSYRAWKAGYRVAFTPGVKVEHHHESTIGKYFDKKKIMKTAFRNQLIFHWKNLTDKDLILKHLLNIPKFIFIPGFFDAFIRLPKILQARKKTIKLFKKNDKEILDLLDSVR